MKSVIGGEGFHRRRGKSVGRGALCEALVHVAAQSAFPESKNWIVLHPFEPTFNDGSIHDIFDFGIFHLPRGSDYGDEALVLQVTQYPDKKNVAEEANKSYEVHETLEEFSYLGSRVRSAKPSCRNLPCKAAFGNIMFGNRRYVRKWIPTHQELFLDFVGYPSYAKQSSFPDEGLYDELDPLANLLDDEQALLAEIKKRVTSKKESVMGKAVSRLSLQFRNYLDKGFPHSPYATAEYRAREEYRHSARFAADITFLRAQIKNGGLPSDRFKLKDTFKAGDPSKVPREWKRTLEAVVEIAAEQMPEVDMGRKLLKNAVTLLPRLLNFCRKKDIDALACLWNSDDKAERTAYRVIFVQLSGGTVDDFYDDEVTEQNFSSKIFGSNKTKKILERIAEGASRSVPKGRDMADWTRRTTRRIDDLFAYMAVNGTKNTPTTWALGYLIESESKLHGRVGNGGNWNSYTSDVLTVATASRIVTFASSKPETLPTVTLRSEYSLKGNVTVYLKSKPTVHEEGRRAKEEGNKAWLGRMKIRTDGAREPTTYFSNDNYWIWVDGDWSNASNLERLVECGWRVFLDPRVMVKALVAA
jgi:hypothetical protein